ncbi:hypothetical protein [Faecalimicrobium sp. JNUCC 81]
MKNFLIQFFKKEEIALWQGDFEFELEIPEEGIEVGIELVILFVKYFK